MLGSLTKGSDHGEGAIATRQVGTLNVTGA